MYQAFIFDVDGTLIDSNESHAQAWTKAFAADGIAVPPEKILPHMGRGADQLLPFFLDKKEIDAVGKRLGGVSGEIFKREYLPHVQPFPKVRELFQAIRATGARIALASSSSADEIKYYRTLAQIDDLVEKAASADDARSTKPQPDILLAALEQLGNPPLDSVVMIGDSPYDAIAAKKAGIASIGVLCGGFPETVLKESGFRQLYQDPADLLAHLNKIVHPRSHG